MYKQRLGLTPYVGCIRLLTSDHSIHYMAYGQTMTHSGYLIEYARGRKWWSNPKLLKKIKNYNQYTDRNIGFRVFYDCMVPLCVKRIKQSVESIKLVPTRVCILPYLTIGYET